MMRRTIRVPRARRRPVSVTGFTMIELLIVIGIIGILSALSTPLYVDWRAQSLNAEAVRFVERGIATSRTEAKRTSTTTLITLQDGESTFGGVEIPNGGQILLPTGSTSTVSFEGRLGLQDPFAPVRFDVRTASGPLQRTATIHVIPPLGKTSVTR